MRRYILLALLMFGFVLPASADIKPRIGPLQNLRNQAGGRQGQAANSIEYELTAADSVKVRMKDLSIEFDEKGHPKKFTAEELKKRKGETAEEQKLPGYKSDFNVLKPGDVIQVSLSKVKDKEAKTFSSSAGSFVGLIVDMSDKSITLRVNPNGPPPQATAMMNRGGDRGGKNPEGKPMPNGNRGGKEGGGAGPAAANRVVIAGDKSQATTILIIEQAPEPEGKRGPERKKDK